MIGLAGLQGCVSGVRTGSRAVANGSALPIRHGERQPAAPSYRENGDASTEAEERPGPQASAAWLRIRAGAALTILSFWVAMR